MKTLQTLAFAVLALVSQLSHAIDSQVAASMYHTVFVDNGNVYGMGLNNYHQADPAVATAVLSNPMLSSESIDTPQFTGVQNAKLVAANGNRTAVVTNDGQLKVWGQLTGTAWTAPYIPFDFSAPITDVALTASKLYFVSGGWLFSWGFSGDPVVVGTQGNVKAIAAGDLHLLILNIDGTVSSLGINNCGQLGYGATSLNTTTPAVIAGIRNAVEIAANTATSFVRLLDGTVLGFGKNASGQLGLNTTTNVGVPTPVPGLSGVQKMAVNYNSAFMLMSDGTVEAAGWHNYIAGSVYNTNKTFVVLPGLSGVKKLHAAGQQIFVDFGDVGQIRGWGGNAKGQLGDATLVERHQPTYGYYTEVPPYQPILADQTCGSLYSNPFSHADHSNAHGHSCSDNGQHNGRS